MVHKIWCENSVWHKWKTYDKHRLVCKGSSLWNREGVVRVFAWFVNIPVSFGGHTPEEPGKS